MRAGGGKKRHSSLIFEEGMVVYECCRTVSSCIWVSKHCRNFDTCIGKWLPHTIWISWWPLWGSYWFSAKMLMHSEHLGSAVKRRFNLWLPTLYSRLCYTLSRNCDDENKPCLCIDWESGWSWDVVALAVEEERVVMTKIVSWRQN
jgi:hypothetical protein